MVIELFCVKIFLVVFLNSSSPIKGEKQWKKRFAFIYTTPASIEEEWILIASLKGDINQAGFLSYSCLSLILWNFKAFQFYTNKTCKYRRTLIIIFALFLCRFHNDCWVESRACNKRKMEIVFFAIYTYQCCLKWSVCRN